MHEKTCACFFYFIIFIIFFNCDLWIIVPSHKCWTRCQDSFGAVDKRCWTWGIKMSPIVWCVMVQWKLVIQPVRCAQILRTWPQTPQWLLWAWIHWILTLSISTVCYVTLDGDNSRVRQKMQRRETCNKGPKLESNPVCCGKDRSLDNWIL